MGEVYLVEHTVLGKTMVAKVLRADLSKDRGVVDRMRIEAQALGALSHPNIVSVHDFGQTARGRPFYVMDHLEGETVGALLRREGAQPLIEALQIARQVLDALGAAHRLGLVHRDIKPENVFLQLARDGRKRVMLLDFGIAKVLAGGVEGGPAPAAIPTAEGTVIGTPRYSSPEQIIGRGVDHRADLYAVGLLLYALASGKHPFDRIHGTKQLFEAHLKHKRAPPSARNPNVPPALDALVLRALEKRPDDRFADAAEFSTALAEVTRDVTRLVMMPPVAAPLEQAALPTSDTMLDATEPAPWLGDPTTPDPLRSDETLVREPRREATEVLRAESVNEAPAPVSTRTAPQPVMAPVQPEAERPKPVPSAQRGVAPYVVGGSVTAVLMCSLVLGAGMGSPFSIALAVMGSSAVGTGIAVFLARRRN